MADRASSQSPELRSRLTEEQIVHDDESWWISGVHLPAATVVQRFDATIDAPGFARHFVTSILRTWGADDLSHVAEQLTSELVATMVVQAAKPLEISLVWRNPALRIEVCDRSPRAVRRVVVPRAERWGLRLVAALAREWGVTTRDDGRTWWFVVVRENAGP
jgi:hypothetical protein